MILSLIGQIVHLLVNAYIFVLFVRMILDWVSVLSPTWRPSGIISSLIGAVYQFDGAAAALVAAIYSAHSDGSHLLRCGVYRTVFHSHRD